MRPTSVLKPPQHSRPRPHGVKGVVAFVKDVAGRFSSDRCTMMGASVAFYSAFSLAPTLLIVLAVIGWFFGRDAAQGKLFHQIKGILGADAASAIQAIVEHAHYSGNGGIAALISIALLVVGASATFSSLNTALDVVFQANSPKGIAGVAFLLRARLVSLGLVMGLAFLLVVSLVLDAAVQTVGNALFGSMALTVFAEVAQTLFGLVILTVGLGALIKWLPDTHVAIRPALIGGLIAAVLFTVGRHLFSFYLAHAGTAGSFGAAGSLAVLMMWLYFCAAVFLLGAEVVAVISGTPSRDDSDADAQEPGAGGPTQGLWKTRAARRSSTSRPQK
ncbi:YihY/virulence factor BrkB family protein [Paraburkholderia terrae]|uniref:YihY/virulence factor BrkB family protein n=1 Tax=Paraburkholderia terrae TaxID=311230 RepID=A0A2I8F4Q6_9BURK|nr:YihY/virulence factor BrkB family protein [Paraburkholderia terrae]AUT66857.1 YihY/virulence factor BrkB family protein [Paraburkholderia terrae]